jgi:branched-chain amino acid transport system substrate-binding protein
LSLRAILLVPCLLAAALLFSCDDDDEAVRARVSALLTLSGPNAVYGTASRQGIELAAEEINGGAVPGVHLDVAFSDDESSAATSSALVAQAVSDGVDAIMGPTLSSSAFEALPAAQAAGIPVVAVSNTAQGITEIGDYIFRASLAEADVIPQTIAAVAEELQPQTAALVFASDDAYSTSAGAVMRDTLQAEGIALVSEQGFESGTEDFTAQIDAIEQADVDVVLLVALAQPSRLFLQQARAAGLSQHIVCGNNCNSTGFLREVGPASEGLIVGAAWNINRQNTLSERFTAAYQERFGEDPDQFAAQGYAATYILAHALREAGTADHEDLREALAETRDLETILGDFSFNAQRDAVHAAVVQVVQDGAFALFGEQSP